MYSKANVKDLGALYRQIAACQRMLREVAQAKVTYADLVNKMMAPATAEEGEQLADEALNLIAVIERESEVKQDLWRYEAELYSRYGIRLGSQIEQREAV